MDDPITLVWFKRDLRVEDHAPLVAAAERGRVLPLYVIEPEVWAEPDASGRQYAFVQDCVLELEAALAARGAPLLIRVGRMPDVLAELRGTAPFSAIFAHEETGNARTFARDLRVQDFARANGIPLREWPTNGIIRRLKDRDGWSARWLARMKPTPLVAPAHLRSTAPQLRSDPWPAPAQLGLAAEHEVQRQTGGRAVGLATLQSFLRRRAQSYQTAMSSPVTAYEQCSRISAHLAHGALSMREVYHATRERIADLRATRAKGEPESGPWLSSLASFEKRLRWHCHFLQKLEDEPDLESHPLSRVYASLRPDEPDQARLLAWADGRTGYPMIDACMRALYSTGWLNFRMRAMLMSFASYHLWLPWRATGLILARRFTDYEAGIHWPQVQMQSGVTGINTVRIYSPTKQALDHDPHGHFLRQHLPELARVPAHRLAEPWRMTAAEQEASGCRIGHHYPAPIVDHPAAVAHAKAQLYGLRKTAPAREAAQVVLERHGSRKRPARHRSS